MTIEGASALNRVRWSSGGKEVAVGDSEGRVWIYDTGEVKIIIMYCLLCDEFTVNLLLVPRNKGRVSAPIFQV